MLHENLLKCLLNIFIGIAICVQPLYLGEIAPTSLRGAMGMGTSIFITGGIFTGQVIGLRWWINTLRRRTFHTVPMLHPFKENIKLKSLYNYTESSWGKRSTGPSCSPPPVSQLFCSSWSCPGSLRAHAICSSTKGMKRVVRKVKQLHRSFHFRSLGIVFFQERWLSACDSVNNKMYKGRNNQRQRHLSFHFKHVMNFWWWKPSDRTPPQTANSHRRLVRYEGSAITWSPVCLMCLQPWSSCTV